MDLRVLIVEDEFLIASMIEAYLSKLGCKVEPPVATVEAALSVLVERDIDLAIVDVNLGGRDSFPVADALEARGIPFVFTTGYGQLGLSERYRNSPVLQKPFRMRDLEAILPALRPRASGNGSV
jgi:DNA-binding response OmpR family regulator